MPCLDFVSPDAALRRVLMEQMENAALWEKEESRWNEFSALAEAVKAWQIRPPQVIVLDASALDGNTAALGAAIAKNDGPISLLILGNPGKALEESLIAETFSKPVRLSHLLTRLQFHGRMAAQKRAPSVTLGPWRFDPRRRCLANADEERKLTDKETGLLEYLCEAKERVTREELLAAVWGYEDGVDTHTLETHIYRLRRKLRPRAGEQEGEDVFLAENGGYRINPLWSRT